MRIKEYLGRIDHEELQERAEYDILQSKGHNVEKLNEKEYKDLTKKYKKEINKDYDEKIKSELDKYTLYQINKLKYLNEVYKLKLNTMNTLWDLYNSNIHYDEVNKNKDIYDFSQYEIETLIKAIPTTSYATKNNVFYFIKQYCEWAVNRGLILENPCVGIDKDVYQTVNVKALQSARVKLEEFQNQMKQLVLKDGFNYIKAMMVIMPRYGVFGKNGAYASNLMWEDIDKENKEVRIVDQETGELITTLPVDDFFIDWVNKCKEYNGEEDNRKKDGEKDNKKQEKYIDNGYVLKQSKVTKKSKDATVSYAVMTLNINEINDELGTNFTPRNLIKDRKIDLLLELRKIRKLTADDFKAVTKLFDPSSSKTAYFQLKKQYEDLTGDEVVNRKPGAKKNPEFYNEEGNYVRKERRESLEE
ncbi:MULTISPECIES: hypothetical protein [unclassified Clostridium]|uniref:phage lytic cycle repressor MrpR family protein n=1 Tax=unclassified Clostridium TaxID=2614128 RepID=UPI0025B7BC0B|nr:MULTISPECIES: hypothetical protein [unclassified Clostridium]